MAIRLHPRDAGLALQRKLKTKKRRQSQAKSAKGKPTEAMLQDQCELFLEANGIVFLHIPAYLLNSGFRNGASSGPEMWAMRNAAVDVRGFPDFAIFHPNLTNYLNVELKTDVGRLTANQSVWRDATGTLIIRSFDSFMAMIQAWILNPNMPRSVLKKYEQE